MDLKYKICSDKFKLTLTDDENTSFDELIQGQWNQKMALGFFRYHLSTLQTKQVGKFIAQLNPMRATTRRMPQAMESVTQKFNPEKFNFTKAPLEKELLAEITSEEEGLEVMVENRDVIVINVSPIDSGHCLLVPNIDDGLPQILTERSIHLALKLVASSGQRNFKMAFNSLCAYASVNHLHWHLYYLQEGFGLYLETSSAAKLSGDCYELRKEDYPGQGFAFQVLDSTQFEEVSAKVFKLVEFLTKENIAHNVFITRGTQFNKSQDNGTYDAIRIFVWARQMVIGNKDPKAFVIAVCELSGQLLIYDKEKYETITEDEINEALTQTCQETFNQVRPKVLSLFKDS